MLTLNMDKIDARLATVINTGSKSELIEFVEKNNSSVLIKKIDKYAEKNLSSIEKDKEKSERFIYLVSTLLLKVQNDFKKDKRPEKFSNQFYETVKVLIKKLTNSNYESFTFSGTS